MFGWGTAREHSASGEQQRNSIRIYMIAYTVSSQDINIIILQKVDGGNSYDEHKH